MHQGILAASQAQLQTLRATSSQHHCLPHPRPVRPSERVRGAAGPAVPRPEQARARAGCGRGAVAPWPSRHASHRAPHANRTWCSAARRPRLTGTRGRARGQRRPAPPCGGGAAPPRARPPARVRGFETAWSRTGVGPRRGVVTLVGGRCSAHHCNGLACQASWPRRWAERRRILSSALSTGTEEPNFPSLRYKGTGPLQGGCISGGAQAEVGGAELCYPGPLIRRRLCLPALVA
jgi:hypothetical protein